MATTCRSRKGRWSRRGSEGGGSGGKFEGKEGKEKEEEEKKKKKKEEEGFFLFFFAFCILKRIREGGDFLCSDLARMRCASKCVVFDESQYLCCVTVFKLFLFPPK